MPSDISEGKLQGLLFNIQRYSIHDGPGIRTTVFMKGCPLRCGWCSNVESQNPYPEFFFRKIKCDRCGKCVALCPQDAVTLGNDGIEIDRQSCDRCMKCADICPTHAISRTGENRTVEFVLKELCKDRLFYRNSEGGVTVSGGEPLFQPDFVFALLKECKKESLHTAIDTSGFGRWEDLGRILDYTDLVLFDIKSLDPEQHMMGTGVDNRLILENLNNTLNKGKRVWIRIPVIPGYNDSRQDAENVAGYLSNMPVEKVSLLGFHNWGSNKYKALGRINPVENSVSLKEEELYPLRDIISSYGLKVTVGY